jgi:GTP cyclohydrolase I
VSIESDNAAMAAYDESVGANTTPVLIQQAVTTLLVALGYNPNDQHFFRTPERVMKALSEFSAVPAYKQEQAEVSALLGVEFDDEHDSMVIVGPTEVTAFCAHHMLPFTGKAWVGYIPDQRVVGLSKLSRLVHYYSRRFTLQERITQQVAGALMDHLAPKGVMVVIDSTHGCMQMRGVRESGATTVTSAVKGVFLNDAAARQEFLNLSSRTRNA